MNDKLYTMLDGSVVEAPSPSPQRLRRKPTMEEIEEIIELKRHLRYDRGWDDSMFFTAKTAFYHEALKIKKQGALKEKS